MYGPRARVGVTAPVPGPCTGPVNTIHIQIQYMLVCIVHIYTICILHILDMLYILYVLYILYTFYVHSIYYLIY